MKLRLIPCDTGFMDLFHRQAAIVAEAAAILAAELHTYRDPATAAARLHELEHAGSRVNHETMARLARTFVAPFDRHAIQDLASSLADVLDLIEEEADKFVVFRLDAPPTGSVVQADLLARSCVVVVEAIDHIERPAELRPYSGELHRLEQEGDTLVRQLTRCLFDGASDVRPVLIGLEIYRGLEAALDRAERVGRVLDRLALSYEPRPSW